MMKRVHSVSDLWFTGRILFYLLFRSFNILESKATETAWSTDDSIALTRRIRRGVGAHHHSTDTMLSFGLTS